MNDIHIHAVETVELFRSWKKKEMINSYQNVGEWSAQIESLLKEMQDDLQSNP
jgi:hypothetical protein